MFQAYIHMHTSNVHERLYNGSETEYHIESTILLSIQRRHSIAIAAQLLHLKCLRTEINSSNDDAHSTCTTSAFDHTFENISHTEIFNLNIIRIVKHRFHCNIVIDISPNFLQVSLRNAFLANKMSSHEKLNAKIVRIVKILPHGKCVVNKDQITNLICSSSKKKLRKSNIQIKCIGSF